MVLHRVVVAKKSGQRGECIRTLTPQERNARIRAEVERIGANLHQNRPEPQPKRFDPRR